ncbi:MAG: hypothetical protein U5L75_03745 [Candidatus Campbellbacteria bacterium]|nr:hypothetical protein [Candidatus Campbellbacteria bacterium]
MEGTFILIMGPSGSGKGTLLSHIRKRFSEEAEVVFPVSCTTRAIRPGEKDGETYYFISREEFNERINNDEFLEWAEYGGNLYGTLKSEIMSPLKDDLVVVREVEVQGVRSILSIFPRPNLHLVYVDAGEWSDFEKRIKSRAPIEDKELKERQERYKDELSFREKADEVISNRDGELGEAKKRMEKIVSSKLSDRVQRES